MSAAAVEVTEISHHYGDLRALCDVTFAVSPGEIFGLLGPNGGGKTTLFGLISTLLPLQQGSLRVFECDARSDPDLVRRSIGVTFQSPSLDVKLTVAENLHCQGMLLGLTRSIRRKAVDRVLAQLQLSERSGDRAESLSGGLRRRVEIAKALLGQPRLLLLDEPASGLDPGARISLWETLQTLRHEQQLSVLLTTHLMEEADKCDRLAILDKGTLVAIGTPDELRDSLGGDCLTIDAQAPDQLMRELTEEFGVECRRVGEQIRIESETAADLVPELARRFRGRLTSLSVSRPSLEDVFVQRTGRTFEPETPA